MSNTIIDKIWDKHIVKAVNEDLDVLFIDQHYLHEVTSPQAFDGLRQRNIKVFKPERCLATCDHNVPTINQHDIKDPLSKKQVETLIKNCDEFGIELFGIGHENQGIVHIIGPELGKTKPGMTIVCGDSHTSTHGAFGSIAFGIGTTQVEQVLAAQSLLLKRPKTMRINIDGKLNKAVTAKDVILYIISQVGAQGATGYFVEYSGEVFRRFSMDERMTVCNMSIEMGAKGGLVGVDRTTIEYVSERTEVSEKEKEEWKALNTDDNAEFEKKINFNAEEIYPIITIGTSPDTGIRFDGKIKSSSFNTPKSLEYMDFRSDQYIVDCPVDYVFIGSCTNGRIEDLRSAAELVEGNIKSENVTAWVVPGSMKVKKQAIEEGLDKIFENAGFEFRDPGCSACLAMNDDKIPSGALCVSTSNRNFEGRQGEGSRTLLASPISAAAAAIAGKIVNPINYIK